MGRFNDVLINDKTDERIIIHRRKASLLNNIYYLDKLYEMKSKVT